MRPRDMVVERERDLALSAQAREAVEEIRRTRDDVGELHEIFVVDREDRLQGWVKERALILADDDAPIRAITTPVPVSVPVTMDQEESFIKEALQGHVYRLSID